LSWKTVARTRAVLQVDGAARLVDESRWTSLASAPPAGSATSTIETLIGSDGAITGTG
jgi:hypothetical protein